MTFKSQTEADNIIDNRITLFVRTENEEIIIIPDMYDKVI